MKKQKTGFSLAEVLLALGIVSVIATMCFSIANKGVDRAYDMFIYTGYKGMTDAIREANALGNKIEFTRVADCQFTKNLLTLFDASNVKLDPVPSGIPLGNTPITFDTPIGIRYKISALMKIEDPDNSEFDKHYYLIEMTVPARKKKAKHSIEDGTKIYMAYLPDDSYGVLIPFHNDSYKGTIENIQDRLDLLPFYVNDGARTASRRKYMSIKEAICGVHGSVKIGSLSLISCGNIPKSTAGAIRLAHPNKVKSF